MIDTGPKFYSVPSPPPCMTLRSRSQTWNFYSMLMFYAKVFRISLFPNPLMDLFHYTPGIYAEGYIVFVVPFVCFSTVKGWQNTKENKAVCSSISNSSECQ